MKKEVVYGVHQEIKDVCLCPEWNSSVYTLSLAVLVGYVTRHTQRKLLGVIPLADKYVWRVDTLVSLTGVKCDGWHKGNEEHLSFESRKRIAEERLKMEFFLRKKCHEYKKKFGKAE